MSRHVLITGATGMLGRQLMATAPKDYSVMAGPTAICGRDWMPSMPSRRRRWMGSSQNTAWTSVSTPLPGQTCRNVKMTKKEHIW